MATRRKIDTPDLTEAEENQEQDQEPSLLPGESDYTPAHLEIDKLLAEYALSDAEVTFHVFREGKAGIKDLSFIASMSPSEFSYEMLKAEPYNAGRFRIYIRNGTGIKRNFGISIEPNKTAPAAKPQEMESAIAAMIAAMSAGFQTLSQQIAQRPAQQGPGFQDMLSLLTAVKPLMVPQQIQPAPDPLELLTKVISLQNELSKTNAIAEGDPSSAILLEAIRSFGPMLGKMATAQTAPAVVAEAPPALSAPQPPAAPAQADTGEQSDMNLKLTLLKGPLLIMAANDRDPYPYACMILDTFSDEEINQYIHADDWWQQLLALIPEAKDYKPWFEKLKAEVVKLLTEDGEASNVGENTTP